MEWISKNGEESDDSSRRRNVVTGLILKFPYTVNPRLALISEIIRTTSPPTCRYTDRVFTSKGKVGLLKVSRRRGAHYLPVVSLSQIFETRFEALSQGLIRRQSRTR